MVRPSSGKPPGVTLFKLVRITAGLRQCDVAKMLGWSPAAYNLRENGRVAVSKGDAVRLAKILKTPVKKLFPGGVE